MLQSMVIGHIALGFADIVHHVKPVHLTAAKKQRKKKEPEFWYLLERTPSYLTISTS